jgi:FHA domain
MQRGNVVPCDTVQPMPMPLVPIWRLFPEPSQLFFLPPQAVIGRDPAADLQLPEPEVSRVHATLLVDDAGVHVADQGSRNGVFVNGRRIGVADVEPGNVLRIGETVLWLGPATPFSMSVDTHVAQHAAHTAPLLIVGQSGSGRRSLAAEVHARSRPSTPLVVFAGHVEPSVVRAEFSGTCVYADPPHPSSLLRPNPPARAIVTAINPVDDWPHTIVVPPLGARLNELMAAVHRLVPHRPAHWTADFVEALSCHRFLLNFQELAVVCRQLPRVDTPLKVKDLPLSVRAAVVEGRQSTPKEITVDVLADALTRHRGNVRRVSLELGVARGQLYRVMAGLSVNPDAYRELESPPTPFFHQAVGSETRDE